MARRTVTVGALAGVVTLVDRILRPSRGEVLGFDVPAGSGGVSRAGAGRPAGSSSAASAGAGTSAGEPGASRVASPGASPVPAQAVSPLATPPGGLELPRGGRTLFPRYRLVGYCGSPGSPALGRLGIGSVDDRVRELEGFAGQYTPVGEPLGRDVVAGAASGRQVLPVLELIAVVVQRFAGADGTYRLRVDDAVVAEYLAAARRHRALLLLNIQPGRADVLGEVRAFDRWLAEPDVGIALDPEWAVRAPIVPGQVFGHLTGAELDAVSDHLAGLVAAHDLPEKVLVVHQLSRSVLRDLDVLRARPGVVVIKSVDGIGNPAQKLATWRDLVTDLPAAMRPGFKLFLDEDAAAGGVMTPAQVLTLRPVPDYVLYE